MLGIFQLVGHGHRIHEAGNRLMIHHHDPVRNVGGNDFAAQLIHRDSGIGRV